MTGTTAVSFVRRSVSQPGSLAEAVERGENPAGLFRAVGGADSGNSPQEGMVGQVPRETFVASSDLAATRLDAVLAGEARFVSTGQQPGLFLGPLYTIYKLVSAINLARRLEESTGVPHLALFWVASDDHDWDEVASCSVLSADETVARLALPAAGRHSVGQSKLPSIVEELVADLRAIVHTGGSERSPYLDHLSVSYAPGRTLGESFVRTLIHVLPGADFVLLDSSSPILRRASSQLYREIIQAPQTVLEAMSLGRSAVTDAGFEVQLTPPDAGLQIFADTGEGRRHILATDGGYGTGSGQSWSADALRELLSTEPEVFSPAAGLRPVLESWLLPVDATVLGPGEVAYWAQLRPLFEALGVAMPSVSIRDGWYLVEPRVDRLMKKTGTDPESIEFGFGELREALIASGRPAAVEEALDQLRAELAERTEALELAGASELPGLAAAVSKTRKSVLESVDQLSRTIDAYALGRQETTLRQLDRLRANLVPEGSPQERALGSAGFLARYGPEIFLSLLDDGRVAGTQSQD